MQQDDFTLATPKDMELLHRELMQAFTLHMYLNICRHFARSRAWSDMKMIRFLHSQQFQGSYTQFETEEQPEAEAAPPVQPEPTKGAGHGFNFFPSDKGND